MKYLSYLLYRTCPELFDILAYPVLIGFGIFVLVCLFSSNDNK